MSQLMIRLVKSLDNKYANLGRGHPSRKRGQDIAVTFYCNLLDQDHDLILKGCLTT